MTAVPYFLESLHKNLQRTISLALCVSKAPPVRPTSAERLASAYAEALRKPVSVPHEDVQRIVSYIGERALVRKYMKGGTLETIRSRLEHGGSFIEAQDWYLSDPSLQSMTGSEKDDSFVKTVAACAELGLISDKTFTREIFGDLIIAIAEDRGLLNNSVESGHNPFRADPAYAAAAYFRILTYDFIFQRELVRMIPEAGITFTALCEKLVDLLATIAREIGVSLNQSNRAAQRWLTARLKSAGELNERLADVRWKESPGVAIQTLYRPFEDLLYPRLEFLVDLGALRKPNPGRYEYIPASGLPALLQLLNRPPEHMMGAFFGVIATMHLRAVKRITAPLEVLEHLRPGFSRFKGITGYAPIAEATIYANMKGWDNDPWPVVEIETSHSALRELATVEPPTARVLADRFRRPETFSILK
jgi:hypothetical protein